MRRNSSVFVQLIALLLVVVSIALAACSDGGAGVPRERLFAPQDNELQVHDLSTGEVTVLIPADRNTVNGQACLIPGGDGEFVMGEDTGQDEGQRQGWGIFSPEGMLIKKILEPESPGEAKQVEPFGCAFDADGRLFVTDVGTGSFGASDGKLIVFFPPDYEQSCLLDTMLRTAGTVAIDDAGNVYVPEPVPPGKVLRFSPPFPSGPDECAQQPAKSTFVEDAEMTTPLGIARAPNGNWYVSSVFIPPTIREYDANGEFVRTIIEGGDIGNPAGLAVDSKGTLYYADLGLVQEPGELPSPGEGTGTVRRVTFDGQGEPATPEIMASGLDFPDAVSVLP